MLFGELQQFRQARHRAVVIHNFREHAGGTQAGEPHEINRRLGVAGATQHAAFAITQRKNVAGANEIVALGFGIGQHLDRVGAVGGGNSRAHAVRGVHGNRVSRAHPFHVLLRHQRQFEPVEFAAFHRHADDAGRVAHHETDVFWRWLFQRRESGRLHSRGWRRPRRRPFFLCGCR